MKIFINGIGSVSAQEFKARSETNEFIQQEGNRRTCREPDYSKLVTPMQLRRMSRVVKMGVAAARYALEDAGIEKPDLITMGTAYGCLADTESFLQKMINQEEQMLTPTAFIQSTHNTVGGQIALLLSCHGHNFTYVQRGHSFESSLEESMMWLAENKDLQILTGGIDETTDHSFEIISRFGTYKNPLDDYNTQSEGTVSGEGANLFILSGKQSTDSYAGVSDIHLCCTVDIAAELTEFLKKNQLNPSIIDTCLVGINGDNRYDETILSHCNALHTAQFLDFKKWCGEYPTSGAFALAMACNILLHQKIPPEWIMQAGANGEQPPRNVLIYNHYKNQYHSFILLKAL